MRLGAVDAEVVGVSRIGNEPAVRVLFRRSEEYCASVLQQLPSLALDTLYGAVIVECQVVPAPAAEREKNLIPGVCECRKNLAFSLVPYGYRVPHDSIIGKNGRAYQHMSGGISGRASVLPVSPVTDSNRAPFPYEGNALPNELTGR